MTNTPKKRLGYTIDDPMRTTTEDAIRVWMTTGESQDETLSVAVVVRCVSMNHELHDALSTQLRTLLRGAVIAYLKKIELKSDDTPAGVESLGGGE